MFFALCCDYGPCPVILCEGLDYEQLAANLAEFHPRERLLDVEKTAVRGACEDNSTDAYLDHEFAGLPTISIGGLTIHVQCIDGLFPGR